ncbi:cupin domain-containing protein [Pedobacter sandarakinus]|uniref:hypothetical protein n=1 Tax=Pedobacter sandarakinus TaxID=353156 RepID=UPI0022461FD9|nr:hypothetical protein [Pedobacter sandarakinus]MCX2575476.1 hypothetical protein [Pedobacter sandarakinus]
MGKIPLKKHIDARYFFAHSDISLEKSLHPAPRRQYVITLSGKLRFTVSNGETFILEPGIVLIAADTLGEGHSWEMLEGRKWERIYIPIADGEADAFEAG